MGHPTENLQIPSSLSRAAFELGWDFASYRGMHLPPDVCPEIVQGFTEGSRRLAHQQKLHDRFDRKWLLLRTNAIRRGREFSPQITPDYLRRIDTKYCPVTFEELTHGECAETDWSVDRVLNNGAYADGNLVIISARANLAKAKMGIREMLKAAGHALTSLQETYRGLTRKEWMRLVSIACGPYYAATGEVLFGPQCTLLHPGVVALPHQIVQVELVYALFRTPGSEEVLKPFRKAGGEKAIKRLRKLERKLNERAPRLPRDKWKLACPFDVWLDPQVFGEFAEWWGMLPNGLADSLIAGVRGGICRPCQNASQDWAVERRGYVD